MFIDRVTLKLVAGGGGNGAVAWRREKYIPKGGPTGGNGGKGGAVIVQVDDQIPSLEAFRNRRLMRADNGGCGGPNRRTGRNGRDLLIKVPSGTLIKDARSGALIIDLKEDGQQWVACRGGRGGRGNAGFVTPTNRAPNTSTPGADGELCEVEFELKLIADVGFVGFPNAGKSTLINEIAKVRVKVAPYPFTTLRPNIGYVEFDDFSRVLIADIPGIIGGAHQNRGLGFEFLRHIERTEVLVYLLDASGIDGRQPLDDFLVLRNELEAYNSEMLQKPFLVVLNKIDTAESVEHIEAFYSACPVDRALVFEMSALNRQGLEGFVEAMRGKAQAKGKRF